MADLTDKTPVKLQLSALLAGIMSIITVTATAYGFHDRALVAIKTSIHESVQEERQVTNEKFDRVSERMKGYLTREEFLKMWHTESAKRDFQYSELILMLERTKNEISRRR